MVPEDVDIAMTPSDPYQVFQEWWGEPIDAQMILRATNAPRSQIIEFLHFARGYKPGEIPALQPGLLRPLVLYNSFYDKTYPTGPLGTAINLLLYAHEAIVEFSFGHPSKPERRAFEQVLRRLLDVKPLADLGVLKFLRVEPSRAHHPSRTDQHYVDVQDKDVPENAWERFTSSIDKLDVLRDGFDYESAVFYLRCFTGAALNLATRWPSRLQLLARSDAEQVLLEVAANRAGRSFIDLRRMQLTKIAGLAVPNYSLEIPGLVAIRQNEEAFAVWRSTLSSALDQVCQLPDSTEDWVREARGIVSAEMAPVRETLEKTTRRSPAMTSAKTGIRSLAFSAFGAAAGALAGDSFTAAIAGAAAGQAGELLVQYLAAAKERRQARAVLDLMLTFSGGKPKRLSS
jgi:hypothetical protein